MTREEKREKELREVAHFHANKFSTRNGYTTPEEACIQTARWADAHQPSPWRDASKELPMMGELVNIAKGRSLGFIRYIEPTDFIDNGVEYWMPIPETPKEETKGNRKTNADRYAALELPGNQNKRNT